MRKSSAAVGEGWSSAGSVDCVDCVGSVGCTATSVVGSVSGGKLGLAVF